MKRTKYDASLVVELVCCLLGSCAFCSALLPALGQEAGMMDCLAFAAVDLSLIFLLSRRWWIAPLLLAVLGFLGWAAIELFRLREAVTAYVAGFIEWYNAAYPYTLPYSENGSRFLVHLAFTFPVTLALYIYFRRLPLLPVWVALSAALLMWMHAASSELFLPAAALLTVVFFVLLARTNAWSINRRLRGEGVPSAAMQLTALALAPLAVLFAFAVGPKTDGAWQSKALVNLVEDVRDVLAFYREGSSGGDSFDLSYSGLAPNGYALGGDVSPNNRPVLRVKTSTPILLAGAVYETYDGRSWYDTGAMGNFRFSSPLWRGKRREVFTIDKPSSNKAAAPFAKVSKTAALEVSMAVKLRAFFSGGKLEKLALPYGDDASVYFNDQGELYAEEYPVSFTVYTIRTRVFDRDREDFDENMQRLLRYAATSKDKEYETIVGRNTAVPDTVEPFVRALAETITADCTDDWERAAAIEKWLGENCTYTQTPGDVPEDRDFVSYFLETGEGYCTYYASAMTVLARLAGLPARYVTGYGLKQADRRPQTTAYIATNATAHAWSQIYFYGIGWVDFDPLRWEFYEPAAADPPVVKETPVEQPQPTPEITPPPTPEPEAPTETEEKAAAAARSRSRSGKGLLVVFGCYLAAFLVFLLVRFVLLFFRVENFYSRLLRRYPDNAARADECYRQILKQLGFLGLRMEPSDTILSFCEKADRLLADAPAHESVAEICRPVLLARFAGQEPTDGELRRMCDFCIFMERCLRRRLGARRYVLRRMLLGR